MTLDEFNYLLQDREIDGSMEIDMLDIPFDCETDDLAIKIKGNHFSVFVDE